MSMSSLSAIVVMLEIAVSLRLLARTLRAFGNVSWCYGFDCQHFHA
jgi:hypothetical protein